MGSRSSRPDVFSKKVVLRNFTKFTGKHLCQSLFFNKIAGVRPATLLKNRLWHRCFPMNFVKFLRTPFLKEHLWWLLLNLRLTTSTRICQLRSNLIADSRVTSEKTRKSLVLALLLIFNNLNLRSLFLIKLQAVSLNH